MGSASLAPPADLFRSPEDLSAFEEARRPVSFVAHLEHGFHLHRADWGGLLFYVLRHREVVPVLLEAPERIRQFFGEVRPSLDLVCDPEAEGWEELFIVVPTRAPVREALGRLKSLDEAWFAAAARRAQFAINVTVEPDV